MGRIFTRNSNAKPVGFETWEQSKAFWFQTLGYKIHVPEVRDFHASNARIKIVEAFARAGKSYSAAHEVIPYAMPVRPMMDALIWLIGPNFKGNREFKDVYEILVEHRDKFRVDGSVYEIERAVNRPGAGDMEIRIVKDRDKHGRRYRTTILGHSAENAKMLQGEEVTLACQSEAAEHDELIYARYLHSRCGWILMPTTPKSASASWLKDLSEQGESSPDLSVETFRYLHHRDMDHPDGPYDESGRPRLYCANPTYDYSRYWEAHALAGQRARLMYGKNATASDDPAFAQEFEGKWVYWSGRVLPFNRRHHVVPLQAFGDLRDARILCSFDYGVADPSAGLLWAILPGPVYFLFDEVYERGLTSDKLRDAVQARLAGHGLKAEGYVGDPSKPEVERVLRDAGLPVVTMDKNAQRDRAAGHRRLTDLLAEGPYPGFPGIYVSSRCKRTIKEWEELHYREGFRNEHSETALRGRDDAYDSARYFLMTRPAPRRFQNENEHPIDRYLRRKREESLAASRSLFHAQIGAHRYAA